MSDTPRTDAVIAARPMQVWPQSAKDAIDLARKLEREVAAYRHALECQIKHCSNGMVHVTARKLLDTP